MNLIFDTQSLGLQVFWSLYNAISSEFPDGLGKTGFFVTNKDTYNNFIDNNPEFLSSAGSVLNEWSILEEAKRIDRPDIEYITKWENRIGDATLWNSVICDRRFCYTLKAQQVQDYRPVYDHDFILKVLQVALSRIDDHFNQVSPDAVLGLNAVTLYDYLYYLIARERGVPYFQLKLTRIKNYVSFYTEPLGISPHIGERIGRYLADPETLRKKTELFDEAKAFIRQATQKSLTYEGAISKKKKQKPKGAKDGAVQLAKAPLNKRVLNLMFNHQSDKHYPTSIQVLLYSKIIKPYRKWRLQKSVFQKTYIEWDRKKDKGKYAVYPLNTEPEVALLVYGRAHRNQIETVRNIASSLPVGWKLVVKEHPNAMGYRGIGFYKKLMEIPNVVLLGPDADTNALISGASLMCVVFGTIGLEAVINRIPVVSFCRTPYGSFPETMVRCVEHMDSLSRVIKSLLDEYDFDEWALLSYIAAHIEGSIRIDLFTGLLGKGGRVTSNRESSISEQYKKLAHYAMTRVNEEHQRNRLL